MEFLQLAKERYSVRKFLEKPVESEKLQRILKAGYLAPTACNKQPQKIYVLNSASALEKLKRCTDCHFYAPAALLICYDRNLSWKRDCDGKDSGEIDAAIVNTHMMLEAAELGIGSTWVMWFDPQAAIREFKLPEHIIPVAFLVMGYPAENAHPAKLHEQYRATDEMVKYL